MVKLPGLTKAKLLKTAVYCPPVVWRGALRFAALWFSFKPNRGVKNWITNATVATGATPNKKMVRAALRSWGRNLFESIQLGRWSRAKILDTVIADEAQVAKLKQALATSGAIVLLPHCGNWDIAGAWACASGMPVSTVAEQLAAEEFKLFLDVRTKLGFKVYSHKQTRSIVDLISDAKAGRLVCLVADRKMSAKGVDTLWHCPGGDQQIMLAAGGAVIAQRIEAPIFPTYTYYQGAKMRIVIGEPFWVASHAKDSSLQNPPGAWPGYQVAESVEEAMQKVADFFTEVARDHVVDWHLFQRFFAVDTADTAGGGK